jgi:hypothetical protein
MRRSAKNATASTRKKAAATSLSEPAPSTPTGDDVQGRSERREPWSEGAAVTLELPIAPAEETPAQAEAPVPLPRSSDGQPKPAPAPSMEDVPSARVIQASTSGLYAEVAPGQGELRIDIDGPDALMTVSGVIVNGLTDRLHWIATVTAVAGDAASGGAVRWTGQIWYKEGSAALLPHQNIEVSVRDIASQREATVRFAGGVTDRTRTYRRRSTGFHTVEFEFDVVEGMKAVTAIKTCDHPNRPASLPCKTLTIEDAFRRAGFDTKVTSAGPSVPLKRTGADKAWSNTEMHDAMQTYWSRFASTAQWSLWVLFAALHEDGQSLGGIMFDDIGPNHRQGTAIFNDSFISQAPATETEKDAWVRRMQFWTAVHEMGHAFNLAHSWQKSLGSSWIPLGDEPEVRSFMNYPYNVQGGQTAFFADFTFRFSDQELLFLRHAPERFVQIGNADWFDDHGFHQAEASPEPKFRLTLRVNRPQAVFDFLEPCMVELKLENTSGDVQLVGENVLADAEHLVVVIKKDGARARQWLPFAQYCRKGRRTVLQSGESVYQALFLGAGRNGWDLAEPGLYTIQVTLRSHGEDYVSNPLRLKILTPEGREDERLAQDFFTQDVGRVLTFDGSRVLEGANSVLQEAIDRMPERPVARHALVALCRPMMDEGKVLQMPDRLMRTPEPAAEVGGAIAMTRAEPDAARAGLERALLEQPAKAAETLGHIEYKFYTDRLVDDLVKGGDPEAAVNVQDQLRTTLEARKVASAVLAQVEAKRAVLVAGNSGVA